jgi:hypothetical protein
MSELDFKTVSGGGIGRDKDKRVALPAPRTDSFAVSALRDGQRARRQRRRRLNVARLQFHDSGFRMFRVF